jgi:hypothetical protein
MGEACANKWEYWEIAYRGFTENAKERRHVEVLGIDWEENIKMDSN